MDRDSCGVHSYVLCVYNTDRDGTSSTRSTTTNTLYLELVLRQTNVKDKPRTHKYMHCTDGSPILQEWRLSGHLSATHYECLESEEAHGVPNFEFTAFPAEKSANTSRPPQNHNALCADNCARHATAQLKDYIV